MSRLRMLVSFVLIMGACLLMQHSIALAHAERTIGGKYDVEVGWDKEPAIVNQPNAATISIVKTGTTDPVEGAENTLKVKISYGGNEAKDVPLHATEDRKGYYLADVIPTRVGDYTFTFSGKIEDSDVNNEVFSSGPSSFDAVISPEALQIPAVFTDASANDAQARSDASTAKTLGIAGIVLGIIGIVIGGLGFMKRK